MLDGSAGSEIEDVLQFKIEDVLQYMQKSFGLVYIYIYQFIEVPI
jgi:hypothetical protein